MRVITFKVDESLLEELDRFAKIFGVSRSEIIRNALSNYLKSARIIRKNNVNIKKVMLT